MKIKKLVYASLLMVVPDVALAQNTTLIGKVIYVEGHEQINCRRVSLRRNDTGATVWFRMPNVTDNSILAAALTAVGNSSTAELTYNPTLTSGCGTEPRILYLGVQTN